MARRILVSLCLSSTSCCSLGLVSGLSITVWAVGVCLHGSISKFSVGFIDTTLLELSIGSLLLLNCHNRMHIRCYLRFEIAKHTAGIRCCHLSTLCSRCLHTGQRRILINRLVDIAIARSTLLVYESARSRTLLVY